MNKLLLVFFIAYSPNGFCFDFDKELKQSEVEQVLYEKETTILEKAQNEIDNLHRNSQDDSEFLISKAENYYTLALNASSRDRSLFLTLANNYNHASRLDPPHPTSTKDVLHNSMIERLVYALQRKINDLKENKVK